MYFNHIVVLRLCKANSNMTQQTVNGFAVQVV